MLKNCNCFNVVTPDQFERVEDIRIHEILKALKKILQMEIIFIYEFGDASELTKNACSAHESHKTKSCFNCHGNSMRFLASLDAFPSESTDNKSSCDQSKLEKIDLNGICIPVTRNESICYGSIYCAPKNRRTPLGMLETQVMVTAAKLIAQRLAPFDQ